MTRSTLPPFDPAASKPDLVLHAGTHKTGSTAIQTFLARHRNRLQAAGLLYPTLAGDPLSHTALQKEVGVAHSSGGKHSPGLTEILAELHEQIQASHATRVVLSSEHFFAMPREWIATLLSVMAPLFSAVSLVIYLRSQRDLWVSLYNQRAKALKVLPSHRLWGSGDYLGAAIVNNMHYADYLDGFSSEIGSERVAARLFDRNGFPDGNVVADFLQATDLATVLPPTTAPEPINPSLGWKGIALSLAFASRHHSLATRQPVARAMRRAFAEAHRQGLADWFGSAPCYLSEEQQRDIRDTYAVHNTRLADSYSPDFDLFLCEPPRPREERALHDIDPSELRQVNAWIRDHLQEGSTPPD